ncbi:MAG: sorbosone dehydrogenase family protein [Ilumatobacteraceae bacterium]
MTEIDRPRGISLAVVVLAAALSACGGDDSAPVDRTGADVTFATQPSTPPPAPPSGSGAPTSTAGPAPSVPSPPTTASGATTPAPAAGPPVVALASIAELDSPVDVAWRAGDTTLYVVEQGGRVVPVRDGQVGDPVLDISDQTDAEGERGLLGLTFSPDGSTAYIDHTDSDDDTVIAAYTVGADGVFDPATRRDLLRIDQPYGNHNGGNVTIGPDGMLYIGMGDGGAAGDPERRALNVGSLLGKILRIDPVPSTDAPYTIPPDNPFVGIEGAHPEIWSVGVRNPWRMAFDPVTGDLWFGDVGQGQIEEVDVAWAADGSGRGFNFGWSAFEGTQRYNEDQPDGGVTPPIFEYPHGDAGCSISGGAVYRGTAIPSLAGWYVYGDYCSGDISALRVENRQVTDTATLGNVDSVSSVRAGPDGELYVTSVAGTVSLVVAA